jgi:sulfur relay (sulfurtransferase) DsrF/TusC family protein
MARYLSIVEVAYRATIEEQDDTATWFSGMLKGGGADIAVLLRADAVNYAVKGQNSTGLKFGNATVKGPEMERDIKVLVDKKIPVFVVAEDLAERGIRGDQVVAGVETVDSKGVVKLIQSYDRILHW